jgi:chemotaxis protein methyltransferase CheR
LEEQKLENDFAFQYLKKKVIGREPNCTGYRDDFLKRRLDGRMNARGISSYVEYAHYLDENPAEFKGLLDALTINVSEFFRDPTVWKAFQTCIIPAIIEEKIHSFQREIRIWSAGCADGEEPYTIAMSIIDALSSNLRTFKIEIVATDVDSQSLDRARRGVYAPARLRLASHSVLQRFFTPVDGGNLRISEKVKRLVTFEPHDLFTFPPWSPFDVISCRNVMIYFSGSLQQRLFQNFHLALSPRGYLILGKVESPVGEYGALFKCVDSAERIYQKADVCRFNQ